MFSELVDTVVARTGRADRLEDIVSYANQTIRSVQSRGFCYNNLIEVQIEATADPHIWSTPVNFQKMKSVRYSNGEFAINKLGRGQELYPNRWYAGLGYIGFTGMLVGSNIDLAYYKFLSRLQYYAVDARPATGVIDPETEVIIWTYNEVDGIDYNSSAALQARARALVSNWVIQRWNDMIQEGTLTKTYKLCGEDQRATMSYSLFQQIRKDEFETTEFEESVPGTGGQR